MCRMNMTQLLLLQLCVLLNMFTHATEEINEIDEELVGKTLTNIYTKAQENLPLFKIDDEKTLLKLSINQKYSEEWPLLTNIDTKEEENLERPHECIVCCHHFPVSLTFPCGHALCALCLELILQKCINNNCPQCRVPLPLLVTDWLTMINIYPCLITPKIDLKDLQHAFPLICAVANLTTVTKCINMGVNVNTKGFHGKFPLTCCQKMDVIKYLVDKGADVNQASNDGVTPLTVNSQEGNLPVVEYLFKKGAFINEVSLLLSSQNGHFHVVQFLVQNGANVNPPGGETLFLSSQNGYLKIVKYLVQNGASVYHPCNMNPVYVSSLYGHLEIVKYLVQNGADLNQPLNGITPLYVSCEKNYLPIVEYLVQNGADVNQAMNSDFVKNIVGSTPLLISSQHGYFAIVEYLVQNGADVKQANNRGTTPLGISCVTGNLQLVQYLIKKGANVNQGTGNGATPLILASENGHLRIVQYLIEIGVDINQASYDEITPLFMAIYHKKTEVAKFLLQKNANIETTKLFLKKHGLLELIYILDELCKQMEDDKVVMPI